MSFRRLHRDPKCAWRGVRRRAGAEDRWSREALLLVWCLLSVGGAGAQGLPLFENTHRLELLTVENGLPSNSVTVILQDAVGFLWVGTRNGLARYDGYSFETFRPEINDSLGFAETDFVGLYEDREGHLWGVARNEGGRLFQFDRVTERFTRYPFDLGMVPLGDGRWPPYPIHESPSMPGVLWIGTDNGLLRFDRRTGAFRLYQQGLGQSGAFSANSVWSIIEGGDGCLWIGSWGLNRFDPRTGAFTPYLPDPARVRFDPLTFASANVVVALLEDRNGTIWAGTNTGLYAFDPKTAAFRRFLPGRFWSLSEDHDGRLRAVRLDGSAFSLDADGAGFTRAGSLPRNAYSLFWDRSGIVWIATGNSGLGKLDPQSRRFSELRLGAELVREIGTEPVTEIFVDREEAVWLGYGMGNVARIDRRTGRSSFYRHNRVGPDSAASGIVTTIYEDRSGVIWSTTCGDGLDRLDRRTGAFTHFRIQSTNPSRFGESCANALLEDRAGTLWVGGWGGGLSRMDRETGRFTSYMSDPDDATSLADDRILSLLEDRTGRLWIGTVNGLSVLGPKRAGVGPGSGQVDAGPFTSYRLPGLRRVMAIREAPNGRLWIGSQGGGLHLFDPETGTSRAFRTRDGLVDDMILDVQIDHQDRLWIATSNGLSRFEPETQSFRNFDTSDGLPSNEFGERSGFRSRTGELYFLTTGGIVVFDPQRISDEAAPPPVSLTGFEPLGRNRSIRAGTPRRADISISERIALSYAERDFALTFSTLWYRRPEKHRYVYRLEGYDDDWRSAGPERRATYTNLPPGTYTFRVKAANGDGVWNEQGASLRISIAPPWWRTIWAYGIYIVVILALSLGGHRWRLRRLRRHADELRLLVRERTRELMAEKKKTEEQAQQLLELGRAKDRFFANLSHEFRTPLTLILGPVEDVLDGVHGPIPRSIGRQLRVARRSGRRLYRLISELLDLTRLDVGRLPLRPRRGDLVAFLREIVASLTPLAERRRVKMRFESPLQTYPFSFDADKIEKVVVNLLSNALEHTAEGGKVLVRLRKATENERVFAELSVRDTGSGIPTNALPHVFDRFYRVESADANKRAGAGIGLALAKSLVELHGGTIQVESEEGFGSTFLVRLPPGPEAEAPEHMQRDDETNVEIPGAPPEWEMANRGDSLLEEPLLLERPDPAGGARRGTILLVEDNADVRAYLRGHLGTRYAIVEAGNGRQGLEKARKVIPDLVIADVLMPEMDGVALCRAIKDDASLRHIPVILLTARASEESEVEGLEAGCDDYVTKPFRAGALWARVENLIEIRRMLRRRFSGEVVVQPSEVAIPSEEAAFLERVRSIVEAHLSDCHFTVEWLAEEVGLSPRQLQRRLHAAIRLTPGGFIRMMRLERAAQLLEKRAGTVSEVAYAVGFQDAGYFAKLFRQAFGVLPSEAATHRTESATDRT